MRVTIITACYNSAATIRDTLECIATQTYPDIEHLIVDGQSTDTTLEIVREFPHVRQVICEPDQGLYDAMNKGIRVASGEVIGILNSDDQYTHVRVLEKVMAKFKDPGTDAVYGDLQFTRASNPDHVVRTWRSGTYTHKSFYQGWMPPHPTFFVRKRVYDQWGCFNTELKMAADYEIMLRFLLKHRIPATYIPEVLVKMRIGGVSTSGWRQRLRANREDRMAWRLNGIRPYPWTLWMKPIRKLTQFLG